MAHKLWASKPSNEEVLAYIRTFFDVLRGGKLEDAEAMVTHAYEDWNENVYNLFQDHYLIHSTPPDSSFEGNWWKTNRGWLADFTMADEAQWMGKLENIAWIDLSYRGEASGYVGEFEVAEQDGGYVVRHNAFRMA